MQRIVQVCLRVAARRWPESMRAERLREWTAELHQLPHRQRLWFAWSLAWSPRVTEDGTTVGWRETLPSSARGVLPIVVLPLVGAGCGAASGLVPHLLGYRMPTGDLYWMSQTSRRQAWRWRRSRRFGWGGGSATGRRWRGPMGGG